MMKKILLFLSLGSICNSILNAQYKPNFLIFLTDDQTYQSISILNNCEIETPNIDRLVQEGVTFTHAFNQGSWSGAVSVASRSMLITGQFLNRVIRNDSYIDDWAHVSHGQPSTEAVLWGEVFKESGYETFLTGKWHNSDYALLKSFSVAKAVGEGMYESISETDSLLSPYNRPSLKNTWSPSDSTLRGHWAPLVRDVLTQNSFQILSAPYRAHKHSSELYGDVAIRYIKDRNGSEPFFMMVNFNAPHDPRQSPIRFIKKYPAENITIPPNFKTKHPFDQGDSKIRDEKLAPFPRTHEAVKLHRQEYYAMITHLDSIIGQILHVLDETDFKDNTYVIFTSDHGLAVGMHGLMGKQNLYDHTIRVPLIMRGPKIMKGEQINEQVYMQSLYATTCELAGIVIPPSVDYKSLLPLLQKKTHKGEEYIYGQYKDLQRMIRSKYYKLIVYPKSYNIQLFDMLNDPYEKVNIAGEIRYRKTLERYLVELVNLQNAFSDTLNIDSLERYNLSSFMN